MPHVRREPMRMCLICGQRRPKSSMLRIVRSSEASLKLDIGERIIGRGCYVCSEPSEIDTGKITGKIKRALKFEGDVPPGLIAKLQNRAKST